MHYKIKLMSDPDIPSQSNIVYSMYEFKKMLSDEYIQLKLKEHCFPWIRRTCGENVLPSNLTYDIIGSIDKIEPGYIDVNVFDAYSSLISNTSFAGLVYGATLTKENNLHIASDMQLYFIEFIDTAIKKEEV